MGGISVTNLLSSSSGISLYERWGNLTTTTTSFQIYYPANSVQTSSVRCCRYGRSRFISCSKASDFQDFLDYARPAHLLSSTEASIFSPSSSVEMFNSFGVDESRSAYIVKLRTSSVSGSCLSDMNAGILLCLIDEKGDSILQRIAASPMNEEAVANTLCFQRGSSDEFIFEGPKLANIAAVWIGLDSGRWRLGGLSLIVINGCKTQPTHTEEGKITPSSGLNYDFEADDIHIGDGTSMSMVELRPQTIADLSGDIQSIIKTGFSQTASSVLRCELSTEESMKEYADLKFSLLLYDAMLIFGGAWITDISTGEKETLAFLTGGAMGFLYLLLLQRSVDGLPAPASVSMEKNSESFNGLVEQLKGPVSSLALVFGFAIAAVKYGSGITSLVLTPQDIIIGMTGFLVCKIAVVLAAVRPMPMRLK